MYMYMYIIYRCTYIHIIYMIYIYITIRKCYILKYIVFRKFKYINYNNFYNSLRISRLYGIWKIVFLRSNYIWLPKIAEAIFGSFGYPHRKWSLSKASEAAIRHRWWALNDSSELGASHILWQTWIFVLNANKKYVEVKLKQCAKRLKVSLYV